MTEPPIIYATYQDEPRPPGPFGAVVGCLFLAPIVAALAYEPLMWVDQHTFPVLGYIAYPLEWIVDKIMFPEAITPFRGNVGALIVGALCAAVIAFGFFLVAAGVVLIGVVGIVCIETTRATKSLYSRITNT